MSDPRKKRPLPLPPPASEKRVGKGLQPNLASKKGKSTRPDPATSAPKVANEPPVPPEDTKIASPPAPLANPASEKVPNGPPRKLLADILGSAGGGNIRDVFNNTAAADDFGPLPPGRYVARIVKGELEVSKSNATPGYKLEYQVVEGKYAGRRFWHDLWLSAGAMPMTKCDLGKIGVVSIDQLERPIPQGIICEVNLVLRKRDDGTEHNKVRSFDVVRIEPPDPFAPDNPTLDNAGEPAGGEG